MLKSLRKARHQRKGIVQTLEFALLLPLFMLFVIISLDLGRYMLVKAATIDLAFSAARAGAMYGAPGTPEDGPAKKSFTSNTDQMPLLSPGSTSLTYVYPQVCTLADVYVDTRVETHMKFVTPFLTQMLGTAGNDQSLTAGVGGTAGFKVVGRGSAKCEVVR